DGVWPVGRRREDFYSARHPRGEGPLPSGGRAKRSTIKLAEAADAEKPAAQLLAKLGIPRSRIADIQRVPWEQLLEAQGQVQGGFTPIMDGSYLPHHPFDPNAPREPTAA